VKFIKAQRIRWLGHVKRMEVGGAMLRKVMEGRLFTGRRKGRPRLRWMDEVVADLRVMKIKQRQEKTEEGSNGDWLLRRPRLTQGYSTEKMNGCVFSHSESHATLVNPLPYTAACEVV
jgi:hypothetical protein